MKVLALINNSPPVLSESLRGLLDREVPQGVVVAGLSPPVAHVNDRGRQDGGVDYHGLSVDDNSPVLEGLLTEQVVREILDGLELLLRVLAAGGEHISHLAGVLSDGLGDAVDRAELRGDVAVFPVDLDDEEGLLQVSHSQIIVLREVLSDTHLFAIVSLEPHGHWGLVEVHILHEVGLLVAVSPDHCLELELVKNLRLFITNVR